MQVDEPTLSWSPPSTRASEVVCSTNVSHYELQVEIGNNSEFLIDPSVLEIKLMTKILFCRQVFSVVTSSIKLDANCVSQVDSINLCLS